MIRLFILCACVLNVVIHYPASAIQDKGTLFASVLNEKGKPTDGVRLSLLGTGQTRVTDYSGRVVFLGISPGTYILRADHPNFEFREDSIRILAGSTISIEQRLHRLSEVVTTRAAHAEPGIVRSQIGGTTRRFSADELRSIPRESAVLSSALLPGVDFNDGIVIRGSAPKTIAHVVDGLDLSDPLQGSDAPVMTANLPAPSIFATEELRVVSGVPSATLPNVNGGYVAISQESGKTGRATSLLRFRIDAPLLFGAADNGLDLEGKDQEILDFKFAAPFPVSDGSSLMFATQYRTDQHHSNGLAVRDPAGNNLGALADQKLWLGNLTGRIGLAFNSAMRLNLGAGYASTSQESSTWSWLYANDFSANSNGRSIEERRAHQRAANVIVNSLFVEWEHRLSQHGSYQLKFSRKLNTTELGRRADFDPARLFGGLEILEPRDGGAVTIEGLTGERNYIIDFYEEVRDLGPTEDDILIAVRPVVNPETGYIEGPARRDGTANPYGLQGFFVTHGNEAGFEFYESQSLLLEGRVNWLLRTGDVRHILRGGFDVNWYSLERHFNPLPWANTLFRDVYSSQWGGNPYTSLAESKELTEQAFTPTNIGGYVEDHIVHDNFFATLGLRFDNFDPDSFRRYTGAVVDSFVSMRGAEDILPRASTKNFVSPRISTAYRLVESISVRAGYGLLFQMPRMQYLYDNVNTEILPGNIYVGNPDIEPYQTELFELGLGFEPERSFTIGITGFLKYFERPVSFAYAPISPVPFTQAARGFEEKSKGVEIDLRRQINSNLSLALHYTLAETTFEAGPDDRSNFVYLGTDGPFGMPVELDSIREYASPLDVRHRFDGILRLAWQEGEGPRIWRSDFLENTSLTLTGSFRSGRPYSRLSRNGELLGEFNARRGPEFWQLDLRILRSIPLGKLLGNRKSSFTLDLFIDVINLTNRTEALAHYSITGNAESDGRSHELTLGDFGRQEWYATVDASPLASRTDQYDAFGKRLYNAAADHNLDGVVTQSEKYESYLRWRADDLSRRPLFQQPRQVYIGFMFRF